MKSQGMREHIQTGSILVVDLPNPSLPLRCGFAILARELQEEHCFPSRCERQSDLKYAKDRE